MKLKYLNTTFGSYLCLRRDHLPPTPPATTTTKEKKSANIFQDVNQYQDLNIENMFLDQRDVSQGKFPDHPLAQFKGILRND